jgi:hypothetical protein
VPKTDLSVSTLSLLEPYATELMLVLPASTRGIASAMTALGCRLRRCTRRLVADTGYRARSGEPPAW